MTSSFSILSCATLAALGLALAACSKPEPPPAASVVSVPQAAPSSPARAFEAADGGIAWQHAANDTDVDAAFAAARAQGQPVFVYWGAKW
ncbi:MAG: hypothetical protein ABJA61_05690, partial [Caldimonas sp.]